MSFEIRDRGGFLQTFATEAEWLAACARTAEDTIPDPPSLPDAIRRSRQFQAPEPEPQPGTTVHGVPDPPDLIRRIKQSEHARKLRERRHR
jgi:hypothetical protein